MGKGFLKKKKQAKAFQEQMAKMQDDLKTKVVEGSAGGGMVTVKINGEQEVQEVKINPECVDPEDVETLEDLILTAMKDASSKVKKEMQSLPMPPMDGLF